MASLDQVKLSDFLHGRVVSIFFWLSAQFTYNCCLSVNLGCVVHPDFASNLTRQQGHPQLFKFLANAGS